MDTETVMSTPTLPIAPSTTRRTSRRSSSRRLRGVALAPATRRRISRTFLARWLPRWGGSSRDFATPTLLSCRSASAAPAQLHARVRPTAVDLDAIGRLRISRETPSTVGSRSLSRCQARRDRGQTAAPTVVRQLAAYALPHAVARSSGLVARDRAGGVVGLLVGVVAGLARRAAVPTMVAPSCPGGEL
jgi:hypothetical protein